MNINELVGKTLTNVIVGSDMESITFESACGKQYQMSHRQDCCETVRIEDLCGDVTDLVGSPILQAEESMSSDPQPGQQEYESFTWTFYRITTMKGQVVIRWLGTSNGYYSETVDFEEV